MEVCAIEEVVAVDVDLVVVVVVVLIGLYDLWT